MTCLPHTQQFVFNQSSHAPFMTEHDQTFPVLEQEIAQGEGEYISAMLNVRGCDVTAHQQIITSVRSDYAETTQEVINTASPRQTKRSLASETPKLLAPCSESSNRSEEHTSELQSR